MMQVAIYHLLTIHRLILCTFANHTIVHNCIWRQTDFKKFKKKVHVQFPCLAFCRNPSISAICCNIQFKTLAFHLFQHFPSKIIAFAKPINQAGVSDHIGGIEGTHPPRPIHLQCYCKSKRWKKKKKKKTLPTKFFSSTSPLRFASDGWPTLHKPLLIVLNVKYVGTIFTLIIWSNISKAHSVSPFLNYPPIKTDYMITLGYKLFSIIPKNKLFATSISPFLR